MWWFIKCGDSHWKHWSMGHVIYENEEPCRMMERERIQSQWDGMKLSTNNILLIFMKFLIQKIRECPNTAVIRYTLYTLTFSANMRWRESHKKMNGYNYRLWVQWFIKSERIRKTENEWSPSHRTSLRVGNKSSESIPQRIMPWNDGRSEIQSA